MTTKIPLRDRHGNIRAFALVDADDVGAVTEHRWYLNANGYARSETAGYMHRFLLGLERGDGHLADRISGDRLDNRRANLRVVDAKGNGQNVSSHRDAISRFRGVTFRRDTGKWVAQAWTCGRRVGLGCFDREEDAARAAAAFRAEHMPYSREAAA